MKSLKALMPGAEFLGMLTNPNENQSAPLPIFTSKPRADGRPGINTLEGWSAAAREINRHSFIDKFGREPVDDSEVNAWVQSLIT